MEWIKNEEYIKRIDQFMKLLTNIEGAIPKRNLYQQYELDIKQIQASDIFYLAMYKEDTKDSIEYIKEWANRFINLFHEGLEKSKPKVYNDLFLKNLILEQSAIEEHLKKVKKEFVKFLSHEENNLKEKLEECLIIERKFLKIENIVFSNLENKLPSNKPLQVLWSLHDDAKRAVKDILKLLEEPNLDLELISQLVSNYLYMLYGINKKHELILYPVTNQVLSVEMLNDMFHESKEYGYAFIEISESSIEQNKKNLEDDFIVRFKTGNLLLSQLNMVLNHLPIDITFIDKDNHVKYYNDSKTRHFPRNPSIIGRRVEFCHPPKSVKVVLDVIEALKNGDKEIAEFWINYNDSLIYITYYAIRDNENEFVGILEVSQDVTRARELVGEQKILDWHK